MNPDRRRWNEKHRAGSHAAPWIPLLLHQGRLARGRALDLAGGVGENAAILALAGWRVATCDLSDEAVVRAKRRAQELRADVGVVQADALRLPFRGPFDLIVSCRFLERAIAPELLRLLAPGGTLFFDQPLSGSHAVAPGEFPRLFPVLDTVLLKEEDGRALYIGRKR